MNPAPQAARIMVPGARSVRIPHLGYAAAWLTSVWPLSARFHSLFANQAFLASVASALLLRARQPGRSTGREPACHAECARAANS